MLRLKIKTQLPLQPPSPSFVIASFPLPIGHAWLNIFISCAQFVEPNTRSNRIFAMFVLIALAATLNSARIVWVFRWNEKKMKEEEKKWKKK